MSLVVDTNKINMELKNLDRLLKYYSENTEDLFYELSKLDSYWKDENKLLFDEKVNKDKINNIFIFDNLNKVSKLYKEIQYIYDKKI